ncbi:plasmid replication protein RepC [Falsirhodobacter deserti]|uniref:plasmid replication protein RepC n=1 Tax=Falsirhodobacter deserti TaxID=1365611 RepID=UPI000FE3B8CE|nr:plasmid replication protein RepC [Falsirhodobacter deserti]
MKHISTTPFGRRTVSAGQMQTDAAAHRALAEAPCPATPIDKWSLLNALAAARRAFGVSDRDLAVLQALVSFHPPRDLSVDEPTIVFPSNARLSERLHGMPESTLRRHIAALVSAGLIMRHDSPNGKRFARRDATGSICRAFGFDLRPLLARANEITEAAEAAHREAAELKQMRETIILHLRDISQLRGATAEAADLHRRLRRKLSLDEVKALAHDVATLATKVLPPQPQAEILSANDSQNERHIQDSNKTPSESEQYVETDECHDLAAVLSACSNSSDYAPAPITDWPRLVATADRVYPMMGIASNVWRDAKRYMGVTDAAITVLCILQRFEHISCPGAYLRSLVKKASIGSFRTEPMIKALLRGAQAG